MQGEPPTKASAPAGPVFLSYASQDAAAAQRICEALRTAGIEVWFDQSELRGGDAWDQKIRHEIHDCALFIPIISEHTQERLEGYFRREWRLAVERVGDMAESKAFLVPIVIDGTDEQSASVPEKFRELHWTRLAAGETPPAFVERVQRLLSGNTSATFRSSVPTSEQTPIARWSKRAVSVAIAVVTAGAVTYLAIERPWISKPTGASLTHVASTAAPGFSPPPHSVAVLPFVNMSGDKDQEYFSEGLTEEVLNSLSRINELQVAARTSSFSFQGEHPDIATVAHKLNVGAVLEGSVRRAGNTVRITAQLVNAPTGFHLWSQTYDRNLGDVLKLQTEIATAVANALKVTLLADIAQKIELGGTRNPAAFDAYLRATMAGKSIHDERDLPSTSIAGYTEAIRLDPRFALAFADRSIDLTTYAANVATGAAISEGFERAETDARQAIELAPELAEAHIALAYVLEQGSLDFARAGEEYAMTLALAPGNARVIRDNGLFAAAMGHFDAAIPAAHRAVLLDPLSFDSHADLAQVLRFARRYGEAATAASEAITQDPGNKAIYTVRGFAYYGLGDLESARTSCESTRDYWQSQWCLAVVYNKLGRYADAEAELAKIKVALGDASAYQYATIYAQWGDRPKALKWLDTAMRLRDPGLEYLRVEPLLDPLRHEAHFQAAMRELKFPD